MSHAPSAKNIHFTDTSSEILEFEKQIAYFYGASHPDLIAKHYVEALSQLEVLGVNATNEKLKSSVLPALLQAYTEVLKQTHLKFNIAEAAKLELSLILAQARKASSEEINAIMQDLYKEIFKSDSYAIHKAAMLRTFLYQYKISVLQNEKHLAENDKKLMLLLAKTSEEELKRIK